MKKSLLFLSAVAGLTLGVFVMDIEETPVQQTYDPHCELPNSNLPTEPSTWHERYVQDNCKRCPECCVEIPAEGGSEALGDFLDATP